MREHDNSVENMLAESLTAHTAELIPYLPYLLQDLWQLGGSPEIAINLLRGPAAQKTRFKVLDLACGKGGVAVPLAKELGVYVRGIDMLPEFINDARQKAREYGVEELCSFTTGDVNRLVDMERGWDCVMANAIGNVLGTPDEALKKLTATVSTGGYILLADSYLPDDRPEVKWANPALFTRSEWEGWFRENHLTIVAEDNTPAEAFSDSNARDMECIERRAAELSEKYPAKAALFSAYAQNQKAEVDDIEDALCSPVWLLQKG